MLAGFLAVVAAMAWVVSRLSLPGDGTVGGHLAQAVLVAVLAYLLTFAMWPRRTRSGGGRPLGG